MNREMTQTVAVPALRSNRTIINAALLVLAVLVVYLPVYRAGFIWDDDEGLTANAFIQAPDGLRVIWFSAKPYDFFPLTNSMFWLEWRLWGKNATGYHVVNVLLHAVGVMLLWRILLRLKIPGAWLAALIFGVHPVCVGSVAWISERKNTLSLVFYLVSILWYLRSDVSVGNGKSEIGNWKWYWLSLFAFLLALLSKTSVVVLPFVLLLCAWWRRFEGSRKSNAECCEPAGLAGGAEASSQPSTLDSRLILRIAPFFALALILGLVTVWFQLLQPRGTDVGYHSDRLWVRLIAGSWAVWFYLGKALLPVQLSMVYPRWDVNPASVVSYLPSLLWLGGMYWCWRQRRSWGGPLLFGLGYFWVALWPVLGVFDMRFLSHTRVADHWQYLALMGVIALVMGGGTAAFVRWGEALDEPQIGAELECVGGSRGRSPHQLHVWRSRVWLAWFLGAAVVVMLSILTWQQAGLYANPERLWRQALRRSPNSPSVWINLGIVTESRGRFAEAEGYYREALRLKPDIPVAQNNLGYVLLNQRRMDEAIPALLTALRLKPDFWEPHYNLGMAYFL
jgi:hypothetical protein